MDGDKTKKNDSREYPIPFWSNDPNILVQSLEFFPTMSMTYEEKLNAITRGIILLTVIGFAISQNFRFLVISALTIVAIYLYYLRDESKKNRDQDGDKEKFKDRDPAIDALYSKNSDIFEEPDSSNPFGNALLTDYEYHPDKKPAPPAFNNNVNDKIMKQAKMLVQELNPDQPNISDKLFKDLGDQYVFEQSLRQFSSNPSTTVVNDQTGFADFCYGSMTSCKEGNLFSCARNLPRHTN